MKITTFVNPHHGGRAHSANAQEKELAKATLEGCWKGDCPYRIDKCAEYDLVEAATCKVYYDRPRAQ